MSPPQNDYTETWLLVFCDPEPLEPDACCYDRWLYRFLYRFLKPTFRHVFAMRRSYGFEGWLVVNPHAANIDVLEVHGDAYVHAVTANSKKGLCHILTIQAHRPACWRPRGFFSCVSVVAHLVGVTGFFMTPWQLYQKLNPHPLGNPHRVNINQNP